MLYRNAQGPISVKIGADNLVRSLGQKDKIISIFQKELEGFRDLREDYERLKDRRNQLIGKCQKVSRELATKSANSDAGIDRTKQIVNSLQSELQSKQYLLRDLKFQFESLLKQSQDRQVNLCRAEEDVQYLRSASEVLKVEYERVCCQVNQYNEELDRIRQYHLKTEITKDKIRGQILNTQGFIRQLVNEESKIKQNLTNIEDQNNSIDDIIGDLNSVIEMTILKIKGVKQEKEDIFSRIKMKQLEKGRIQTEQTQKQRQLKAERGREKNLKEATHLKSNEIKKLSQMLVQVEEESEQIFKSNTEVQQINAQLENDLKICLIHLENVAKNNNVVKRQLEQFYKINLIAMKKLKKPTDEGQVDLTFEDKQDKEQAEYQTADCFTSLSN